MSSFCHGSISTRICGLLCVLVSAPLAAEPIYKSVDEAGNITYSAKPESGSVQTQSVPVPPPPSKEQQQEAKRIERQLRGSSRSTTGGLDQRKRESSQRVKGAEAKLQAARGELEKAQVKKDDDWQNLAQGGRHLKESYFQRVNDAEATVQQAEQELAKALRDMR